MATEVFINIKDLPELTQPNNGDYIIIETSTGTHLLDFKNLVLPTANTVITTTVDQNTTAILTNTTNINSISSYLISLSSNISPSISQNTQTITQNTTSIDALQTTVNTLSTKVDGLVYIGKTQVTIPTGNFQASNSLTPAPTTSIEVKDIIITPANAYASIYPAYVGNVNGVNVNINTGSLSAATQDAIYNVMAIVHS